jgi:hypothetical protein
MSDQGTSISVGVGMRVGGVEVGSEDSEAGRDRTLSMIVSAELVTVS